MSLMDEREKQELLERTLALDETQAEIIASALPVHILKKALDDRLSDLMDFRRKYEELAEQLKGVAY